VKGNLEGVIAAKREELAGKIDVMINRVVKAIGDAVKLAEQREAAEKERARTNEIKADIAAMREEHAASEKRRDEELANNDNIQAQRFDDLAKKNSDDIEKLNKTLAEKQASLDKALQKIQDNHGEDLKRIQDSMQRLAMSAQPQTGGYGGMPAIEGPPGGGGGGRRGGGRTIHTGPRGGRYYINGNGNRTYV
jgi:colicin import membrane protein